MERAAQELFEQRAGRRGGFRDWPGHRPVQSVGMGAGAGAKLYQDGFPGTIVWAENERSDAIMRWRGDAGRAADGRRRWFDPRVRR